MDFLEFLYNPFFTAAKYVELEGGVQTLPNTSVDSFVFKNVNSFLIGTLEDSILDLEFFQSFDELTVEICNDYGHRLFFETIDAIEGIHIIADLSEKDAWCYHVHVYNSYGVNVYGKFEL